MEDNVKGFPGAPQHKDNDVATENSVLGSLLNSDGHPMDCREAVLEVFAQAQSKVFVHPVNRKIFSAFTQCLIDGTSSTPQDVISVLRQEGDLDDEILDRVYEIAGSAGGMIEAEHGAKILYNLYRRRIVATAMEDGARQVRSGEKDADVAITDAFTEVSKAVELGDMPDSRFERARLVDQGFGVALGLRTIEQGMSYGLPDLDQRLGGMQPRHMSAFGARSGGGKTIFAGNVGRDVAVKQDIPVVIFSLEMTPGDLIQRAASAELAIPYRKIQDDDLTSEERDRIRRFADREEKNKNFRVEYVPGATANEIYFLARKSVRDMGAALVIVDYAQSVNGDREFKDTNSKMEQTVGRINEIATKLGPHVMLLTQLRKPTAGREGEAPNIQDMLYGTKIENVATSIVLLHRPHVDGKPGYEAEAHTEKNRRGTLGVDELIFDGAHQRFLPAGARLNMKLGDL